VNQLQFEKACTDHYIVIKLLMTIVATSEHYLNWVEVSFCNL